MEPMAVSPGKSPSHTGQYLPSFLLGELASPLSGGTASSPLPTANYSSRGSRTKVEGPPIVGLFDEINSSPSQSPTSNASAYFSPYHNNSMSMLDTSCLENQENKSYWVVVFGFPPAQVSQIVAMFSQLGRVVEHNYPVNSNWVCIAYANQCDMRKALSMDKKVLSGNVMIGVEERKHQLLKKENDHCYLQICCVHDIPTSPHTPQSSFSIPSPLPKDKIGNDNCGLGANVTLNSSIGNVSTPVSPKIRPLALSKRQNIAQMPGSPGPVPTADTSLVGKFMDFIFSW